TDLIHPSVTFFLIQATARPAPGDDIDSDNDGVPDGSEFATWTVLDSVGVLDADGTGDIAYGLVNFRRDSAPGSTAKASGLIVPLSFTPRYIARSPTIRSPGTNWIAGDALEGTAPNWKLGTAAYTFPKQLAGAALDHLGRPNFGAADLTEKLLLSEVLVNPP